MLDWIVSIVVPIRCRRCPFWSRLCESFDKVNEYVAATMKPLVIIFSLFGHKPTTLACDYLTFARIATVDDEIHGCGRVSVMSVDVLSEKKESNTKRQAVSITYSQVDRISIKQRLMHLYQLGTFLFHYVQYCLILIPLLRHLHNAQRCHGSLSLGLQS